MPDFRVQEVGSHLGKVVFHGAVVAVGFLASFRRPSHDACLSGSGFVSMVVAGKRAITPCACAIGRAERRLGRVGRQVFEQHASEWLEAERIRVRESEERCRREGRESAPGAVNPYPGGTDQALAWDEGASARAVP